MTQLTVHSLSKRLQSDVYGFRKRFESAENRPASRETEKLHIRSTSPARRGSRVSTSAILLLMGLSTTCNNTASGDAPAPTNQSSIQTPPQPQKESLARIIKYCPPDTDSIAVLDLQRVNASKQFRTFSGDASVVRFALATALEAWPVINPTQQLIEKIGLQTNRLVVIGRPGFLNAAIILDGEYNESELLTLMKRLVKQSGIESLKVDIRANYTEYSFGNEVRLFVIDGRIIMLTFSPEYHKFVTTPNDKAAENRFVNAVAHQYASPNVLLAYAYADSDRRLHLFGDGDKYEPKFDIHRGTLRDTGSALVLKMQMSHRTLALTKSSQADFKKQIATLAKQYEDLPIVGDLRQGTVTRDDTLITATVQTTGNSLAQSKIAIVQYLTAKAPKAKATPVDTPKHTQKHPVPNDAKTRKKYTPTHPSDHKAVSNLENKVDKTETKNKTLTPAIFIPGNTKDLDEVRLYSDELIQPSGPEREKFLNDIKGQKGFVYNFHKGYLSLTPKSDMPEFYESMKDCAITFMVMEDGEISSEEKKFIKTHAAKSLADDLAKFSSRWDAAFGKSERISKKAHPKDKSKTSESPSGVPRSHKIYDALLGPIFESWKQAQLRKIEDDFRKESGELSKTITDGILEAGRIYFENQKKVPRK